MRLGTRVTNGTLAVAVLACVLLTPGAASANFNRVEIVNASNPLFRADVMWASTQDGQGVFLWPNNNSLSQEFDLIDMGVVTYRSGRTARFFQIRARHSGKCLMLARNQGTIGNGTRIVQYPCTGPTYKSAQWTFKDMNGNCEADALCIDSGRRIIMNRYPSTPRCLDADNASGKRPGQKAILQLWTCISSPSAWNADNQIWKIMDPVTRRAITQFG
jgi:Ricin-type beta-trefoil lectin domain-like